ncbi:MAG: fatty acid desaturase [Alcanivoracaceae bacterium]|nr:fatty acid desaturase [Alcanivoracaceae bacterium]
MPIYRHRADILPSLIVLGVFAIQLWAVFSLESTTALLIVAASLLMFSACPGSISHNHHHTMTFRHRWMNRVYEVILFLETGVPPFAWTLHHNLGHHQHYLDPKLDPSAWQQKDGKTMNRIRYDLYNAARVYPEVIRIGRSRPKLLRNFITWTSVSLAVLAVLIWLAPKQALIVFVLPMPIMLLGLLDNTYQQHQGLDMSGDHCASRNTTSRLYNLISWNLGYHTAHHMHPGVHWSKLPELHEKISHQIPAHLICNSVLLSSCDRQPKPRYQGRGGRAMRPGMVSQPES